MMSGPEMLRLIAKFESDCHHTEMEDHRHHKSGHYILTATLLQRRERNHPNRQSIWESITWRLPPTGAFVCSYMCIRMDARKPDEHTIRVLKCTGTSCNKCWLIDHAPSTNPSNRMESRSSAKQRQKRRLRWKHVNWKRKSVCLDVCTPQFVPLKVTEMNYFFTKLNRILHRCLTCHGLLRHGKNPASFYACQRQPGRSQ